MEALYINNLNKSYGDHQVLHDMTLQVQPGEMYGFVGSNGAGKSTTMRIALGVLAADSGEVLLGDRPIDDDLRRRIGYMPEERGLYAKEKIGDQLRFFARLHGLSDKAARKNAEGLLEQLGLAERSDRLVAILVMTGLNGLFGWEFLTHLTLWVLAAATTYTVVFRVLKVRRQAVERDAVR